MNDHSSSFNQHHIIFQHQINSLLKLEHTASPERGLQVSYHCSELVLTGHVHLLSRRRGAQGESVPQSSLFACCCDGRLDGEENGRAEENRRLANTLEQQDRRECTFRCQRAKLKTFKVLFGSNVFLKNSQLVLLYTCAVGL